MHATEILILGAGPAGISAAIQLKRYGLDFTLIDKDVPGGLLRNANLVENYPGFPGGIPGNELVARFQQQAAEIGVRVTCAEIKRLDYHDSQFWAETAEMSYCGKTAVIATGTKSKKLSAAEAAEPEAQARIFSEILPIRALEGKKIAIIGGGDLAFDYALNLGQKNEVTILNRGDETRCLPLLWERAERAASITYREKTEVVKITAEGEGIRLEWFPLGGNAGSGTENKGQQTSLWANYLVFAIGREPQVDFAAPSLLQAAPQLEKEGRLYWVGDVKNGIYRQAAIAAGDGVITAMRIYHCLKGTPR